MSATPPARSAHVVGFLPVITFVLWAACVLVGIIGYSLPYARPHLSSSAQPAVAVEKITVQLDRSPPDKNTPSLRPEPALPPPPLTPPLAVAPPSSSLAFPLPVTGPVRIVDSNRASSSASNQAAHPPPSIAQSLVFGKGEGRQPAPAYPSTAVRQGQEGVVTIRINVAKDGRVATAEVAQSSPWPLLNEAAVRVVREQWRFSPGSPRTYEVAIRFTLQK